MHQGTSCAAGDDVAPCAAGDDVAPCAAGDDVAPCRLSQRPRYCRACWAVAAPTSSCPISTLRSNYLQHLPVHFFNKQVSQSYGAFNHILGDLSLIVNQFESLSAFSAGIDRLGEFLERMNAMSEPLAKMVWKTCLLRVSSWDGRFGPSSHPPCSWLLWFVCLACLLCLSVRLQPVAPLRRRTQAFVLLNLVVPAPLKTILARRRRLRRYGRQAWPAGSPAGCIASAFFH